MKRITLTKFKEICDGLGTSTYTLSSDTIVSTIRNAHVSVYFAPWAIKISGESYVAVGSVKDVFLSNNKDAVEFVVELNNGDVYSLIVT